MLSLAAKPTVFRLARSANRARTSVKMAAEKLNKATSDSTWKSLLSQEQVRRSSLSCRAACAPPPPRAPTSCCGASCGPARVLWPSATSLVRLVRPAQPRRFHVAVGSVARARARAAARAGLARCLRGSHRAQARESDELQRSERERTGARACARRGCSDDRHRSTTSFATRAPSARAPASTTSLRRPAESSSAPRAARPSTRAFPLLWLRGSTARELQRMCAAASALTSHHRPLRPCAGPAPSSTRAAAGRRFTTTSLAQWSGTSTTAAACVAWRSRAPTAAATWATCSRASALATPSTSATASTRCLSNTCRSRSRPSALWLAWQWRRGRLPVHGSVRCHVVAADMCARCAVLSRQLAVCTVTGLAVCTVAGKV